MGYPVTRNVRLYRYRSIDRAFYCTACLRGGSVCDPDRFDASDPNTGGLRDCQQADCRGTDLQPVGFRGGRSVGMPPYERFAQSGTQRYCDF